MTLLQKIENHEQGFTLVEMLFAISLSSILFGIVFQLFQVSQAGFDQSWHKSDFYRSTQKALLLISSEIMASQNIALKNSKTLQLKKGSESIRYKIKMDQESQWIIRQLYHPMQKQWLNVPQGPVAVCQKDVSNGALEFALKKIASGYYRIAIKNKTDVLSTSCYLRD